MAELRTPVQFDAAGEFIKPDELDNSIRISAEPQQHIEWLQRDLNIGFSELMLHNVNRNQQLFIEVFGEKVVPFLQQAKVPVQL